MQQLIVCDLFLALLAILIHLDAREARRYPDLSVPRVIDRTSLKLPLLLASIVIPVARPTALRIEASHP
ncbi:hypothetical protein E4U16_006189, partial [Claviceps sp. LM84 group G4]